MDPYIVQHLFTARHDDLVRDADDSRLAREAKDSREGFRPAHKPVHRESRSHRARFV